MKPIIPSIVLLLSVLTISSVSHSQDDIGIPDGPYLGQTPPGSTPEVFAPGIVNTKEYREIEGMFAADMKAFYFIKRPLGEESKSNVLAVIEYKNNQWQESVAKKGVSEPSISPDGMTVYFAKEYMQRTS